MLSTPPPPPRAVRSDRPKARRRLTFSADTKICSKTPELSSKSLFGGKMSLPVPISVSLPAVQEWFGRRKANIRPFGTFFNTNNFQV